MTKPPSRIRYKGQLYVQADPQEPSRFDLEKRVLGVLLHNLARAMERKRDDGQLEKEDYANLQWVYRAKSALPSKTTPMPGIIGDPLKDTRAKAEELAARFGVDYPQLWKEKFAATDIPPDAAEVIKMVLGGAGITVDQICTLADSLKSLCETEETPGE